MWLPQRSVELASKLCLSVGVAICQMPVAMCPLSDALSDARCRLFGGVNMLSKLRGKAAIAGTRRSASRPAGHVFNAVPKAITLQMLQLHPKPVSLQPFTICSSCRE